MEDTTPLVSIIIPTYNRADLLPETLDSIIAQTYSNWECIVVDDGSTDETIDVLKAYVSKDERFFCYERPTKDIKGVNSCRKYGLHKSKGNFICWFDSDDIMDPQKLSICVKVLNEETLDVVFHNFNYFRPDVYVGRPYNDFQSTTDIAWSHLSGELILNFQSALWKRSSIDASLMKTELNYAEDVYFIANHYLSPGFKCKFIDHVLTKVRKHEQSLTASSMTRPLSLVKDEIYVRQKFWKRFRATNNDLAKGTLKMYLKSLKPLLHIEEYRLFYRRIFSVFAYVGFKYNLLIPKLIMLSLGHILSKRGITLYKNLVNKL